jgi:hypothetical protein
VKKYDPDHAPNPAEWLRLDEQLRIALCAEHHRRTVDDDPANIQAHAAFHAIVENQIAENYEPAVRAAARLAGEGLTRHEAIHAIASVLVEYLYEASKLSEKQAIEVMKVDYRAALEWLIKDRWLDG